MKAFATIIVIAIIVLAGWYLISNTGTEISLSPTESPTATPTPLGQGGEGPEDFPDEEPGEADESPTATPQPIATSTPTPVPILAFRTVTEMNGSGEHGTIVITSRGSNQTEINFNIAGAPVGVSQPVYIYKGTSCQASEQVLYGLNPLVNGGSMTILPIRASEFISGGDPWRLVIHQSADNMIRVACAVIK